MPPLPPALAYLWRIFNRLSRRRPYGAAGPLHIPWSEILAFQTVTGIRLYPFELAMIEMLDDLLLAGPAKNDEDTDG